MKLNLKYYLRGLGLGIVVTAVVMGILNAGDDEMTNEEIIARAKQLGMIEDTVLTDGLKNEEQDDGVSSAEEQGDDGAQADENENTDNGETGTESRTDDTGTQTAKTLIPDSWTGATTVEAAEAGSLGDGGNDAAQDDSQGAGNNGSGAEQAGTPGTGDGDNGVAQAGTPGIGDGDSDAAHDDDGMAEAPSQDEPAVFPKVLIISSGEGSYTVSKKLVQIGAIESAEDFDTYLCENGYDKKIRAGTYTIPVGATNEQMAKIVTGAKISE